MAATGVTHLILLVMLYLIDLRPGLWTWLPGGGGGPGRR